MNGLRLDVRGAVATITLDRPQAGNAIDQDIADGLLKAAHQVQAEGAIRVVILTGAGRFFCAGGDVAAFASAGPSLPRLLLELTGSLHMAIARLHRMSKPLVCAVNGPAAGAGLGLALMGDIVVAAQSAHFSVAYPGVGLSPDAGCSFLLPRLVGLRRARQMIMLNQKVSASEAVTIGLITQVVADAAFDEEVAALAARLVEGPTRALGRSRSLLLDAFTGDLEGHLEREARTIALCGAEPDSAEGISAFVGRRPAKFEG